MSLSPLRVSLYHSRLWAEKLYREAEHLRVVSCPTSTLSGPFTLNPPSWKQDIDKLIIFYHIRSRFSYRHIRDKEWYDVVFAVDLVAGLADELAGSPGDLSDHRDPGEGIARPVSPLVDIGDSVIVGSIAVIVRCARLEQPGDLRQGEALDGALERILLTELIESLRRQGCRVHSGLRSDDKREVLRLGLVGLVEHSNGIGSGFGEAEFIHPQHRPRVGRSLVGFNREISAVSGVDFPSIRTVPARENMLNHESLKDLLINYHSTVG